MRLAAAGSERQHQVALIEWARRWRCMHPELDLLFAIPNQAARRGPNARRLTEEGVRAGMPDLCLPVARGGYHACYLELKRPPAGKNPEKRLTAAQRERMAVLQAVGNHVALVIGWDQARDVLIAYIIGRLVRKPSPENRAGADPRS